MRMLSESRQELLWFISAICGIWLGFANDWHSLPPAILLWPLSLACLGQLAKKPGRAFWLGWLASFFGLLAALYWLALPVAQVGGLAWPFAALCAMAIAATLALAGGAFACVAFYSANFPVLILAPLLALGWYLLEMGFGLYLGFPWTAISGALAQWPLLIQGASVFGAYLLSAVWLFAIFCLYFAIKARCGQRWLLLGTGTAVIAGLLGYGAKQLTEAKLNSGIDKSNLVEAVMVEGNIDQNQKWLPAFQNESLEIYLALTEAGLAQAKKLGMAQPLIIWPETAMPFFYQKNRFLGSRIERATAAWGCPLLFGSPGVENPDAADELIFNRAFLLGPDGKLLGYYDKEQLVPFGEYAPAWLKLDFLEPLLQGVGVYAKGVKTLPLNHEKLAPGILICYEGIFPWLAQARVKAGANLLIDISNDGWFGYTPAARQHLYLTILRCVEQGRWLLRATNTGISAVADAQGRIRQMGPMFKAGFILGRAQLNKETTVFHKTADWLPWVSLALFASLASMGHTFARFKKK